MQKTMRKATLAAVAVVGLSGVAFADAAALAEIPALRYFANDAEGFAPAYYYGYSTHLLNNGTFRNEYACDKLDKVCVFYDFGSAHVVKAFDYAPLYDWNYAYTSKDYKVYGSNDKVSWDLLYDQDGVTPGDGIVQHALTGTTAYRYVRVSGVYGPRIAEFRPYGAEELMIKANFARTAGDTPAVESQTDPQGVKISGTLVSAPSGSAHIYAYAAKTHCGFSRAAWIAAGAAVVDFGEVNAGENFVGRFTGLGKGTWQWQVFAVNGDTAVSSQPTVEFVVGSEPFLPKAYARYQSKNNIKTAYDGNATGGFPDQDGWIVFDLKDLPKNRRLAAVYLWPYTGWSGSWGRPATGELAVGYLTGDEPTWTVYETVRGADQKRPLDVVSNDPTGITWKQVDLLPYEVCNSGDKFIEYPFNPKPMKINGAQYEPRYVRYRLPSMNVHEVELRTLPKPGMAIFFE